MRRALTIAVLAAFSLLCPLSLQVALAAALPLNHAQYVTRVLDLVNAERQRVGRPPLVANGALTRAAQAYAGVMGDGTCFSHTCGSTLAERVDRAGYTSWTAAGENIALGTATPEAVVAAWMASSGHRANIVSGDFKEIGIGLTVRPNGEIVWVQAFGTSRNPIATPPPAICTPRPAFSARTRKVAAGMLEVTIAAGTTVGAPGNTLLAIRVGTITNAGIGVSGYGSASTGTTVGIAPGTQLATFLVQRPTGGAATTIRLVLTDACGEWRTFVGAGRGAF